MRYKAFTTTSSTSVYGQHVQLRCFCVGLANWYFAERGANRKKEKLNYPVRDKNREIIQRTREHLSRDRQSSREDAAITGDQGALPTAPAGLPSEISVNLFALPPMIFLPWRVVSKASRPNGVKDIL
jgi:hypothetical protein